MQTTKLCWQSNLQLGVFLPLRRRLRFGNLKTNRKVYSSAFRARAAIDRNEHATLTGFSLGRTVSGSGSCKPNRRVIIHEVKPLTACWRLIYFAVSTKKMKSMKADVIQEEQSHQVHVIHL